MTKNIKTVDASNVMDYVNSNLNTIFLEVIIPEQQLIETREVLNRHGYSIHFHPPYKEQEFAIELTKRYSVRIIVDWEKYEKRMIEMLDIMETLFKSTKSRDGNYDTD